MPTLNALANQLQACNYTDDSLVAKVMELTTILNRGAELRDLAFRLGFSISDEPWTQPLYSLWASSDKANCNANCGILEDARSYLRDAEQEARRAYKIQVEADWVRRDSAPEDLAFGGRLGGVAEGFDELVFHVTTCAFRGKPNPPQFAQKTFVVTQRDNVSGGYDSLWTTLNSLTDSTILTEGN